MIRSVLCWLIPLLYGSISLDPSRFAVLSPENQNNKELLNGRIWRNEYSKAIGDQFFMTNNFVKGSVVFNGKKFSDLDLLYDIAGDELILRQESYPIIFLNKEMVDSFDLMIGNSNYHIINTGIDTSSLLRGYVNVLYEGPSTLYVKYSKKLYPLAVDGRYDLFYQEHSVFVKKGSELIPVSGRRMFLGVLADNKKEVTHFIRSAKIRVSHRDPATYAVVLKYYDSLK